MRSSSARMSEGTTRTRRRLWRGRQAYFRTVQQSKRQSRFRHKDTERGVPCPCPCSYTQRSASNTTGEIRRHLHDDGLVRPEDCLDPVSIRRKRLARLRSLTCGSKEENHRIARREVGRAPCGAEERGVRPGLGMATLVDLTHSGCFDRPALIPFPSSFFVNSLTDSHYEAPAVLSRVPHHPRLSSLRSR